MKIIHTADWHLGDRLGRVDRTEDLRLAVERVADVCVRERADVLLVCGDLFSELIRAETLRHSVEHLNATFGDFLRDGGAVLALTGNHDNEHFAQVLRQAMTLAAPALTRPGALVPGGRFYLFPGPTFLRLRDREGTAVQFVMMPFPTASRYLDQDARAYSGRDEYNRAIKAAFRRRMDGIFASPQYQAACPTVLAAHVMTAGARVKGGKGLGEGRALVFDDADLPAALAYVALGDVHKPQCLLGLSHVRYSGSIERMDLGEAGDEKGVVVVDVGPGGRRGEPAWAPLPSTPIYRVAVDDPDAQLPGLAEQYPDRQEALVHLTVKYRPGRDNLTELLARLDEIFPRWYVRECEECGAPAAGPGADPAAGGPHAPPRSCGQIVRDYLSAQLDEHPDRAEVLAAAESLLGEEQL